MKDWRNILIIALIAAVCVLASLSRCNRDKLDVAENNLKALQDTVRVYELKNGDLMSAKQNLILEKENLSRHLSITDNERKEIERKLKSAIAYIGEIEGKVKIDTLTLHDSVYIENGIANICFSYSDKWVSLDGKTEMKDSVSAATQINSIVMDVPLKMGLTDDNQMFVTSSNPYVLISDIDGAQILTKKNKPKRWGFGPYIGVGVGWGVGIGFEGNTGSKGGFVAGVTVGFAVHYDIWQW